MTAGCLRQYDYRLKTVRFYHGISIDVWSEVPDACLYDWCKLFLRELNKQTNVSNYPCPSAYIVDFYYTHMCFDFFLFFSIFRACCNHCFVLWRHTQFHLTVFSSVFLSCAVQFVQ